MPKISEGKIAITALTVLAAWLLIALPLLYLPGGGHVDGEFLGIKYGEWLLFLATMGLWWATWRLVSGADKTAERQLRAYVSNVSGTIRNVRAGGAVEVKIEIKNWGQTPAHKVRHAANYILAHYPWSGSSEIANFQYQSESTLGAGANSFLLIKAATPITAEHFYGLNDGSLAIYVEGRITYVDIFGRNRHVTYRLLVGGVRGFPPDDAMFSDNQGNDAN